jgi:rhodanese-related sulfurtransferase
VNKKIVLWFVIAALVVVGVLVLTMPAPAVQKNIGNDELLQLQSAGATVVDVRTQQEFESGHIPSSANVPLDQLPQASASWDKDAAVVVYCATGARSAEAASLLAGEGFRKVYNLEKGVAAWTGELAGGQADVALPTGAGAVKTGGRPLFIDFSSST